MAGRTRRLWSTIRAEIRALLAETTAGNSFWTDAMLLIYVNMALDLRGAQLGITVGRALNQRIAADLVSGQRNYTIPEGTESITKVCMLHTIGNTTFESPVWQNDAVYSAVQTSTDGGSQISDYQPSARLVGSEIFLEPPPPAALTNGLIWYVDCLGARLTGDSSTLPAYFPSLAETLISYDVWEIACGVEDATDIMSEADSQGVARLRATHAKIERVWEELIDQRFAAPERGEPYYLGD